MATNKNQHFVPRCYLRPFSVGNAGACINLYNIDRKCFIEGASLRHQCSGNYFYGQDAKLEAAIQLVETTYSSTLREILSPGHTLLDAHRLTLRRFWLLQHLRTEHASQRSVEMAHATEAAAQIESSSFRFQIREAVQYAMAIFAEAMEVIDDLKICLVRNRTSVPFVTSDDPAVLSNRWQQQAQRARGLSFGLHSAGALVLLPLTPDVLCLGYDGDVYSVAHKKGWIETRQASDVHALNEHQYLNCRANIFIQDAAHASIVNESFIGCESRRPDTRHLINYAVLDQNNDSYSSYRVIDPKDAVEHQEAIIHSQIVHPIPSAWPRILGWRSRGFVFTNGTGVGYVRRRGTDSGNTQPFRKERALG